MPSGTENTGSITGRGNKAAVVGAIIGLVTAIFIGSLRFLLSEEPEYLEQLERFSSLAARDRFEEGQRAQWVHLLCYPPAIFLKNYLLRLGFLDGKPGLAVSILAAVSSLFKDLKLWEIQTGSTKEMPMNSRDA